LLNLDAYSDALVVLGTAGIVVPILRPHDAARCPGRLSPAVSIIPRRCECRDDAADA
jgi:hypothetical protein